MSRHWSELDEVARLARIRLSEKERRQMGEQLERIIGYVRKLEEIDLDEVSPTRHLLEIVDVDREDRERPSLSRERLLEQAPETDEDRFVVPAVLPDRSR